MASTVSRTKVYREGVLRHAWQRCRANGTLRPLGFPIIKDRVVQMAAVIVMEPVFEADLTEEQDGYRPGRSAHDAIRRIHGWLNRGYREGVDADLSG